LKNNIKALSSLIYFICNFLYFTNLKAETLLSKNVDKSLKFENIKIQIEDFRNKFNLKNFNKKNYFCLDDESEGISETLEILNLDKICTKEKFPVYQGKNVISDFDDIIDFVSISPQFKSNNLNYLSSTFIRNASKKAAYYPYLSSSGSLSKSFPYTKTITNYSIQDSSPSNASSTTETDYSTTSWELSPSLIIPLFTPSQRGLYEYYDYASKSSKRIYSYQDQTAYKTSLINTLNLWINYQLFSINVENLDLTLKNHNLTLDKYKLGLIGIADLATSLSLVRNQQIALSQSLNTYKDSHINLAKSLGLTPEKLSIDKIFFSTSSLQKILRYKVPNLKVLKKLALIRNDNVFYYLNEYLSDLGYKNYYSGSSLPSLYGQIAYSLSDSNSDYTVTSTDIDKYSRDSDTNSTSFSLNFSWNIFDFGKNKDYAQQWQKTAEANLELSKQAAISSISSITQTFQDIKNEEIQLINSFQSMEANKLSFEKTLLAFEGGFTDAESLNDKLKSYISSSKQYTTYLSEYLISKLDIMNGIKDSYFKTFKFNNEENDKRLLKKLDL